MRSMFAAMMPFTSPTVVMMSCFSSSSVGGVVTVMGSPHLSAARSHRRLLRWRLGHGVALEILAGLLGRRLRLGARLQLLAGGVTQPAETLETSDLGLIEFLGRVLVAFDVVILAGDEHAVLQPRANRFVGDDVAAATLLRGSCGTGRGSRGSGRLAGAGAAGVRHDNPLDWG